MKTSDKKRVKNMRKGKSNKIGFIEKYAIKRAGNNDGKRELPRKTDDGNYSSPYMEGEIHSFNEFEYKAYAELQIDLQSDYTRLGVLKDSIDNHQKVLKEAKREYEAACSRIPTSIRRKGENKLTEAQVVARRNAEKAKQLSPLKEKVSSLDRQLHSELDEFIALRNKTIEDTNTTRLICKKMREHVLQRIAVYWDAAITYNSKIPVIPSVILGSNAEAVFIEPHRGFLEDIDRLIRSFEVKEVS